MFYIAISRISDPKNMKIINFKDEYIKCDMTAFNYETKGEYMTYFERMLIVMIVMIVMIVIMMKIN